MITSTGPIVLTNKQVQVINAVLGNHHLIKFTVADGWITVQNSDVTVQLPHDGANGIQMSMMLNSRLRSGDAFLLEEGAYTSEWVPVIHRGQSSDVFRVWMDDCAPTTPIEDTGSDLTGTFDPKIVRRVALASDCSTPEYRDLRMGQRNSLWATDGYRVHASSIYPEGQQFSVDARIAIALTALSDHGWMLYDNGVISATDGSFIAAIRIARDDLDISSVVSERDRLTNPPILTLSAHESRALAERIDNGIRTLPRDQKHGAFVVVDPPNRRMVLVTSRIGYALDVDGLSGNYSFLIKATHLIDMLSTIYTDGASQTNIYTSGFRGLVVSLSDIEVYVYPLRG